MEGIVVANTFAKRLGGLRRRNAAGMLFHTSSVHGFGFVGPLQLIHLSRSGIVVGHDQLGVGGLARSLDYWLLEVWPDAMLPPIGARIVVVPSSPG